MFTRIKSLLRMEHRYSYYSQAVEDALMAAASTATVEPSATAAIETAVRALSAPYGVSTISGPSVSSTPAFLVDLARRLYSTCGNAVYRIDTGDGLDLVAASGFDVGGSAGRLGLFTGNAAAGR